MGEIGAQNAPISPIFLTLLKAENHASARVVQKARAVDLLCSKHAKHTFTLFLETENHASARVVRKARAVDLLCSKHAKHTHHAIS